MKVAFSVFLLASILWSDLVLSATPSLLRYVPIDEGKARIAASSSGAVLRTERQVSLNAETIKTVPAGGTVALSLPSGDTYLAIHDRDEQTGGGLVWVGHINGYDPTRFPIHISVLGESTVGSIETPDGSFQIHGQVTKATLTLVNRTMSSGTDDARLIPKLAVPAEQKAGVGGFFPHSMSASLYSPATITSPSKIDMMVLYTTGYAALVGGDALARTRVNQLIASANTALLNSGIFITLNLVYSGPIAYPDGDKIGIDQTLYDFQSGIAFTGCTQYGTSSVSQVHSLRNLYGADLVSVLTADVYPETPCGTSGGAVGIAYVGDPQGSDPTGAFAYSVVRDFEYTSGSSGSGSFGSEMTFVHELGHNMGSQHDAITQLSPIIGGVPQGTNTGGIPPYSRGYCNGNAGTIMAYADSNDGCPHIDLLFSNPALATCDGLACGVPIGQSYPIYVTGFYSGTSVGADNTTAFNANAPYMAAYRNVALLQVLPIIFDDACDNIANQVCQ